jgi:hypothetical protein
MEMKHSVVRRVVILALVLIVSGTAAWAQGTFKIPYKFEAGGKKLPAGIYWIGTKDDGQLVIRQEAKNIEIILPVLQRLAQPTLPVTESQVVLDAVGNFEPSYSEYVTDYLLAEVWFPGQDGFLIRALKGAHQHQTIKGERPGG